MPQTNQILKVMTFESVVVENRKWLASREILTEILKSKHILYAFPEPKQNREKPKDSPL